MEFFKKWRRFKLLALLDYCQDCLPTSSGLKSQSLLNIRAQRTLLDSDGHTGEKIQKKTTWLFM